MIERFLELENQFYTQPNTPINESSNLVNQNILETQSDTYEEVAVANIESKIAWSERATPSIHSGNLSPVSNHDNNQLSNLIDEANNLNDNDLIESVKETFKEDVGLKIDVEYLVSLIELPLF